MSTIQSPHLTVAQMNTLELVGRSGGSSLRLADVATRAELLDLERAGYLWHESADTMRIWYLTDPGAEAVGIDPARIYHA
jgi:hypothetical protein